MIIFADPFRNVRMNFFRIKSAGIEVLFLKNGTIRINAPRFYIWVLFLSGILKRRLPFLPFRCPLTKCVILSICLLPDLRAGAFVMCFPLERLSYWFIHTELGIFSANRAATGIIRSRIGWLYVSSGKRSLPRPWHAAYQTFLLIAYP